jgi:uncharacterized protein (TIGR02996 family)
MNNEEGLLRSVVQNPFDDARRLVYADWLEEQGDVRGELLRVQLELAHLDPTSDRYRELWKREKELLPKINKPWLQRIQRYTTPKPCRDITQAIPELKKFAQTSIRLHPHRMAKDRPTDESKFGGQFLWPEDEEWPSCPDCKVPLVPIVQLRKYDIPDVKFYKGTDLVQLLWCVKESAHQWHPKPALFWRKAEQVKKARTEWPDLSPERIQQIDSEAEYLVPKPCSVHPERVVVFPDLDTLRELAGKKMQEIDRKFDDFDFAGADLQERLSSQHGPNDPYGLYQYELEECSGACVGGRVPIKKGKKVFDHFLTLHSAEFGGEGFRRWLPLEDQRRIARLGKPLTAKRLFEEFDRERRLELQESTGMRLGRSQRLYMYICRQADPWTVQVRIGD